MTSKFTYNQGFSIESFSKQKFTSIIESFSATNNRQVFFKKLPTQETIITYFPNKNFTSKLLLPTTVTQKPQFNDSALNSYHEVVLNNLTQYNVANFMYLVNTLATKSQRQKVKCEADWDIQVSEKNALSVN